MRLGISIEEFKNLQDRLLYLPFYYDEIRDFIKPTCDKIIEKIFAELGKITKRHFTSSIRFSMVDGIERLRYNVVCDEITNVLPRSCLGMIALVDDYLYQEYPYLSFNHPFYHNLWEHAWITLQDISDRVSEVLQRKAHREVSNRYNEWFEDESEDEDDGYVDEDFDEVDGIPQERYDFD